MFRQIIAVAAVIAASTAYMPAPAMAAQAEQSQKVRTDTPSGYPVPRFVSLKATQTFCRAGPSFDHPVRMTFMRQGLPVVIIAETRDHWRKIRDRDGDSCWVHKTKLSGADTALVIADGVALHAKPNIKAPVRARLGEGLIANVEKSRGSWRRISVNGLNGWAQAADLWGASAPPAYIAARN